MKNNSYEFHSIICIGTLPQDVEFDYQQFPIFTHVPPDKFIEAFLTLSYEDKIQVLYYIGERYKVNNIAKNLVDELEFFKEVQKLLLVEVSNKPGKLSGYLLSKLNEFYLVGIIHHLEEIKNSQLQNIP